MLLPEKLESLEVQVSPLDEVANFPELPTATYWPEPFEVIALIFDVPNVESVTRVQEAGINATGKVAFIAWVAISIKLPSFHLEASYLRLA